CFHVPANCLPPIHENSCLLELIKNAGCGQLLLELLYRFAAELSHVVMVRQCLYYGSRSFPPGLEGGVHFLVFSGYGGMVFDDLAYLVSVCYCWLEETIVLVLVIEYDATVQSVAAERLLVKSDFPFRNTPNKMGVHVFNLRIWQVIDVASDVEVE